MTTAQQQQNEELETDPSAFDAQGRVAPLNRKEYKRFLTRGILQSYRERNEKTPKLTQETAEEMAKAFGF